MIGLGSDNDKLKSSRHFHLKNNRQSKNFTEEILIINRTENIENASKCCTYVS